MRSTYSFNEVTLPYPPPSPNRTLQFPKKVKINFGLGKTVTFGNGYMAYESNRFYYFAFNCRPAYEVACKRVSQHFVLTELEQ